MTTPITVLYNGGETTFGPDVEVRIGRSATNDIVVEDSRVSRDPHLVLRNEGGVWVLEDHSAGGTYAGGQRIERVSLPDRHSFTLGAVDGPELTVSVGAAAAQPPVQPAAQPPAQPAAPQPPVQQPAAPQPPVPPQQPAPGLGNPAHAGAAMAAPVAGAAAAAQPPAAHVPQPDPNATVMHSERNLRVSAGDDERVVYPGQRLVVGRGEDCDLVVDNSLVSRHHVAFEHDGNQWTATDLGSSRGTFIDGSKISGRKPIQGAFNMVLGDDDAGEQLRIITGGVHTKPKSKLPLLVGAALALAALAVVVALVASRGGDDGTDLANSDEQRIAARAATGQILLLDGDRQAIGISGSGVLIDDQGTMITNAHVAYIGTYDRRIGQEPIAEDAPFFGIAFASVDGGQLDKFYIAEPVAVHPYHDAAVIRIVSNVDGSPATDLPAPLALGTSSDLKPGDAMDSLGFPGSAVTDRLSLAVVNFQSFKRVASCSDSQTQIQVSNGVCNPSGAVAEGWLNVAGAGLGSGSSGGPLVRDGVVVGLNEGNLRLGEQDEGVEVGVPIDEVISGLPVG